MALALAQCHRPGGGRIAGDRGAAAAVGARAGATATTTRPGEDGCIVLDLELPPDLEELDSVFSV